MASAEEGGSATAEAGDDVAAIPGLKHAPAGVTLQTIKSLGIRKRSHVARKPRDSVFLLIAF